MNPTMFQNENPVFNTVYFNDLTKKIHEVTICSKMYQSKQRKTFKIRIAFLF